MSGANIMAQSPAEEGCCGSDLSEKVLSKEWPLLIPVIWRTWLPGSQQGFVLRLTPIQAPVLAARAVSTIQAPAETLQS